MAASSFLYSLQSEWLKKKRSAASWLVITGGLLVPVIVLLSRIIDFQTLPAANASSHLWEMLYSRCWQFMAIFLLPIGIILAASLIIQLEFKNNAWKQVHTLPQRFSHVFLSKLVVIIVMMIQFFILFNIGIYLAGVVPGLLFRNVHYPKEAIPYAALLKGNGRFFVDCLPVIALQYLLSLQFKNFLVPVGVGFVLYVASMMAMLWKYGYIAPYAYCALNFQRQQQAAQSVNIHAWAAGYSAVFIISGYILYITKKEKG